MKDYLKRLLMDSSGQPSTKRWLAWAAVIAAIALAFAKDSAQSIPFLTFAAAAVGFSIKESP